MMTNYKIKPFQDQHWKTNQQPCLVNWNILVSIYIYDISWC